MVIYLILISLVSICVTVSDKRRAIKNRTGARLRRVPEKTLLWLAALGGSVAMYITMHLIRHKTKHQKFTLGIPAIIFAQICLVFLFRALS